MSILANHPPAMDFSAAPRARDQSDLEIFKQDLKDLLLGAQKKSGGRSGHMVKYDYSSIVPHGYNESGADLWNDVTTFGQVSGYYIPLEEGKLIKESRDYFARLYTENPMAVDLGPGSNQALHLKSIPTIKAIGAAAYLSVDINEHSARSAAHTVSVECDKIVRTTSYTHGDFTNLSKLNVTPPVLMMMYGCTASQYPIEPDSGETTLSELLINLGEMVSYNAVMVLTLDIDKGNSTAHDNFITCYNGKHFKKFKNHFWLTTKAMIDSLPDANNNYIAVNGDRTASPLDALTYIPRWQSDGIVHTFLCTENMTFMIDGDRFDIPSGTKIETGFSKKWSLDTVQKAITKEKTGWEIVKILNDNSSVTGLVLVGKNATKTQYDLAKDDLVSTRSGGGKIGSAKGAKTKRCRNLGPKRASDSSRRQELAIFAA